jgi:Arc/MetJ-type ribon-helix-helix transcriptional regulator
MEVFLPPDLQQFIADQVQSGVFPTTNEAMCRAVETLRDQSVEPNSGRDELLREIDLGLAEIERNEGTEVPPEKLPEFFDNVIRQGRQRLLNSRSGEPRA